MMNYVDFWGRPDPDMLEVGNGDLTLEENRAHFALWAVMKSPLIIGTSVSPHTYQLILNLTFQFSLTNLTKITSPFSKTNTSSPSVKTHLSAGQPTRTSGDTTQIGRLMLNTPLSIGLALLPH